MPVQIPDAVQDLLTRPIAAGLATLMPDGHPQITPIWFLYEEPYIRFSTSAARQKARNLSRESKLSLLILDPQNPFHYAEIRGHVVEVSDQNTNDLMRRLAIAYTNNDDISRYAADDRVSYTVAIDKINGQ